MLRVELVRDDWKDEMSCCVRDVGILDRNENILEKIGVAVVLRCSKERESAAL